MEVYFYQDIVAQGITIGLLISVCAGGFAWGIRLCIKLFSNLTH